MFDTRAWRDSAVVGGDGIEPPTSTELTERRLARLLLGLANPYHAGQKPIPVTLSQEVLAEMVGTTRSRVSTFMNKFRDEGLINYDSYSRRIEVYSAKLLSLLGS